MTCSIGLSVFPKDAQDGPTLQKLADDAMYRAKKAWRNGYAMACLLWVNSSTSTQLSAPQLTAQMARTIRL